MRVIAGTARSLPLKTPEGLDTRPTTDRIKETLFNILQDDIPGSVVLDLFAGSGSLGIEAISRGAKRVYFIENGKEALGCIRANLTFTRLADRAVVLGQDVCAGLAGIHEKRIDVVLMDPPYGCGHEERALRALGRVEGITDETIIVIEAALGEDMSYAEDAGYTIVREKRYKTNKHVFLRVKNDLPAGEYPHGNGAARGNDYGKSCVSREL